MALSESNSELVMELAEEFLERYRKGERPPLREYIDKHPELAAEIKEVFPAMALMENIAVADESGDEEIGPKPDARAKPALEQLGDYRIIREIGYGGMGVVYEAEQVSLGRHVALKVLPNQALQDAKQKRRFEREAKAAAELHHTNIVPVFGVGEHEGLPYYVMQFIQGLGLDAVLDELNRMQPGAAPTPTGLRAGGEIRISRRDVSAADMARSLMTGGFQSASSAGKAGDAQAKPTFEATIDQSAGRVPQENARPRVSAPSTGQPAHSESSSPESLADSFTVSSSSITLPGSSVTGHKAAAKKPTYWQSVANIGRQVADALEYAHKQGVLHRDVKPSNLLLDLRGTVWVTDFGLAKVAGPGAENLTHTGDILGTLRYMPPEAFEGKSDARGDVYSLGLTLYELLARRPAFNEKDRNRLIKQVTTGEPIPLDQANKEIPRDLVTIIQKSIEREPSRRYATAENFAADLQRFLDDEPILARRQTHVERYVRWARHNPGIAVLGGVLTAVLVLATAASLIVASRMSILADNEAQAAADERTAKQTAIEAQKREAEERAQAELAKKDADLNRKRAEAALQKAEEHFTKARSAVNDYLTAVSDDERLKAPGLQGLRIQLLQSALQFYQQFLKERGTDPTLRRELAGIYFKVGEVYRDLGKLPEAKPAYAQARRLYETLAKESPNDPELQHGLAMSYYRSGAYAQAILILEKLINPEDPRYHSELASMYNDVTIRDTKAGQAKDLEFLRKALTVRERLVRLKPDDPDARVGLSGSLNNIAIRLKEDRNAEALVMLQRAVEQGEAAYRLRPADTLTARYLTIQLNNVATKAKREGATEIVLAAHRRRVEVLDRRARDNPTIAGFDAELAAGYTTLLGELRDAGRLEEAAKVADKARVRLAETTEESTGFFAQVLRFHLTSYAVALARAKADPDTDVNTEGEAVAAVNAMRRYILAGGRDSKLLQSDPGTESLRQRADFQELFARQDELGLADGTAKRTTPTVEEKLAARQTILTTLEALAGPPPYARFVRRNLAQARQDWAQTLLVAGQVDEARLAFDDALLARQQLVLESPSNEELRADLAQSQAAAGELFAAAGKLADAVKTWDKALDTLEEGLKTNPNSIPFRTALAERLLHIAYQAAKVGLWDLAANYQRRAMVIQIPTEPIQWNFMALVALKTQDLPLQRAVADLAARSSDNSGNYGVFRHRALTTSPDTAAAHVAAIRKLGDEVQGAGHNVHWLRALAYLRAGQAKKALQTIEGLSPAEKGWPEWQTLALIRHRLGQAGAAAEALRQADLLAERRMKEAVAGDQLKLPLFAWDEWLHNELLRAEAHQAIHGKPLPASPYERLFRGRVLFALEQHDKAEAEFAAAVAVRPNDADVWLTRSRVFAKLGGKDRMAADLLRAQELKGNDPRTWVETGRALAEQGEHKQADVAFARAAALGKGELNRFLEAGWWVSGPYPQRLETLCPPEINPDPSKPVPAVGDKRELKWQSVATTADSGNINLPKLTIGGQSKVSSYALNYVYADRDRTAILHLWPKHDAWIWVNGRVVFAGFGEGLKSSAIQIPVTLRQGRNTLLVKNRHDDGATCECAFLDAQQADDAYARLVEIDPKQPRLWIDRGRRLGELKRWDEAAKAFDKAVELAPKDAQVWKERGRAHAELGKWDEAAADFVKAIELAPAPTAKPPTFPWAVDRWGIDDLLVQWDEVFERVAKRRPKDSVLWVRRAQHFAGLGRWAEAEASLLRYQALEPGNHWGPYQVAPLLLQRGDVDGYRRIAAAMVKRFGNTKNWSVGEKTVRTALLRPGVVTDFAALAVILDEGAKDAATRSEAESKAALTWIRIARAHVAYRSGDFAGAIHQLTAAGPPMDGPGSQGAEVVILLAMARQQLGDPAAAREALAKARAIVDKKAARPDLGWLYDNHDWYQWVRCRVLLREAESLIPKDQVVAAPATLSPQEQAARRDRKARADSLSTQAALALIRLDVGQKKEAEAELRAVLAEREKIAAEEPGNLDYQADLAAAHEQLGQFLVSAERLEEGVKETQQAIAILQQFAAGNPKAARLQIGLVASLFRVGNLHWQAGRLKQGGQAWKDAQEILKANRAAAAKDPDLAKTEMDLELVAGEAYAKLGLWTEASGHFRRAFAADPVAGNAHIRYFHAALLVLTGDLAEYRRYCTSVYERSGKNLQDKTSAKMMVLAPGALPDPKDVVAVVQAAIDATNDRWWSVLDLALAQLRADQVEDARATLPKFEWISKNLWSFSWPSLALARHKAGKIDEAREWLRKTEDWYSQNWMEHLATDSTGLPKGGDLYFWAFCLCLRQEAIATVTGQPAPADPWQHLHRGRVYFKLGESDKAEAEFQAAVKVQPDDARIWLARSRIYARLGKQAEAQADRAQAMQLAEKALAKRPDDNAAAVVLAGFLQEKAEAKWTVLKPLTVQSEGGATLTVQPDDSVLAGRVNPDQDVYVFETEVQGRIGAIRLEAIPDASMPAGGSGRAPSTGKFVLTDFRVLARESVVTWSRANADFSQETENGESKRFPIAFAIDADESTGWSIGHRVAEPHWAVFIPREPIAAAGKTRLTMRLAFRNTEKLQHTLGRFRLSVTDESALIQQSDLFLAASTPLAKVGTAYLALGDAKQAADFLTKATAANPKLPATEWLVLALAHAKLNESDQAKKACGKAAELLKPVGVNDALRPLLREVLRLTGTNHVEAAQLLAIAAGKPTASLNEAIQKSPKEAKGYRDRGNWYAERGQWQEAAADLAEAYRLEPTASDALRLGVLLAQIGDAERYRKHGQEVLTRFESTTKNVEADQALKTCLFLPDAKLDPMKQARLVEAVMAGDQGSYTWFLFAQGLYGYRTGKHADALTAYRESRRRTSESGGISHPLTALNSVGEAMALHQTGDLAAARRTLTEAKSSLDSFVPGIDTTAWNDWLAAHLLYREAEGLIAGKKAELPK